VPIDVRNLAIDEVIVHHVPKRDRAIDADTAITFSDAPIPDLDRTRRNYFGERINTSLVERPFAIVPLAGPTTRVPELVATVIADPTKLVDASQDMARALYGAQTGVNNPGLLTVVLGQLGAERCVAVLKLQHHEAMRMEPIMTPDGRQTYSAEILGDLTLTDDTRVFKASLFRATGTGPTDLEGLASDDQRGSDFGADLANFWLSTFLGCGFAKAPDRTTRDLYDASTAYFETLPDPEDRIEYRRALVATLLSPTTTISAPSFSQQFLRDEHKAGYDAMLAERGVTGTTFDKDLRLIKSQLKRTRLTTVHSLTITGPPDEINERVKVEPGEGTAPSRIVILDEVSGVGG
jgi:hypothetical protein